MHAADDEEAPTEKVLLGTPMNVRECFVNFSEVGLSMVC